MPKKPTYLLTPTARRQIREAKAWSLARWGQELTAKYFRDVENAASDLAANYTRYITRSELAGQSGLCLHPAREHYIVYEPLAGNKIAIVAFLRQGRDVAHLLTRNAAIFHTELEKIRGRK